MKMKENWPNFFIVGADRSGTTSLYSYLKQHPQVYMSPRKEPYYFCADIIPTGISEPPIRLKEDYLKLFSNVKNEIAIGEASATYLRDPHAAERIYQVVPHAKIIISLRDPVERTFSDYLSRVTIGLEKSSFTDVIERDLAEHKSGKVSARNIITGSFYYKPVKKYIDVFGRENVKILIFEEFTQNIKNTVKELLSFLGITGDIHDFEEEAVGTYGRPKNILAKFILTNQNVRKLVSYVIPKETRQKLGTKYLLTKENKPRMSLDNKKFLENLYHDDAFEIRTLLNRSLPWALLEE